MPDKSFPINFTSRGTAYLGDKLLIQNKDTGVDQFVLIADVLKGITNQVMTLADQSPQHGLLPIMIRNVERMNYPWPASETRWLVTAHDTVNKIITLDRDLPVEIMDYGTDTNKRWQLQGVSGSNIQITSINWITKQIYYTTLRGAFAVNDKVTFWNPFRNFAMNPFTYVIGPNAWATTYLSPGGIWLHSDGQYRMIVNGWDTAHGMTGLYKSADLLTWTDVTGAYYYHANVHPFDEAWCVGAATHWTYGSPVKVPATAYYAKPFQGLNAAGRGQVGIVIHDEDFAIITMPATGIDIPGYPVDATHDYRPGGMVYYKGVLYLAVTYKNTATNAFTTLLVTLDAPSTYVVTSVEVITTNTANSYTELTAENPCPFIFNNELYVLVSGENSSVDGPLENARMTYGLFHKKYGTWQPHVQNPVLSAPLFGENVYAGCDWAVGHAGTSLSFIQRGNYLHLFVSMLLSANTYHIAKMDMLLKI